MVTRVRGQGGNQGSSVPPTSTRPSSDGMMYGDFNERRLEYDDILTSERSDSQYSQSESYLSERSVDSLREKLITFHVHDIYFSASLLWIQWFNIILVYFLQ